MHGHIGEAGALEVGDTFRTGMAHAGAVGECFREAPDCGVRRAGPIVVEHLSNEVHFTARFERGEGTPDHLGDDLAAVHWQVACHHRDIAACREGVAREIDGFGADPVRNVVFVDELAGHGNDRGEVADHGGQAVELLCRDDRVGARAASEVHHAFAAGQVDIPRETPAGAETDAGRRLVIVPRALDRHVDDRARCDLRGFVRLQQLCQVTPLAPAGTHELQPRAGIPGLALDEKALQIRRIAIDRAVPFQQAARAAHGHEAVGVQFRDARFRRKRGWRTGTRGYGGKEAKVNCGEQRRAVDEDAGQARRAVVAVIVTEVRHARFSSAARRSVRHAGGLHRAGERA